MIVAQAHMVPNADTFSTMLNAWAGTIALRPTPASAIVPVARMPTYGTPPVDIREAILGALPFIDIDRRMRPVEYRPAFRLENAAVSTTRFMIVPAPWMPSLAKKVTNGLVLELKSV